MKIKEILLKENTELAISVLDLIDGVKVLLGKYLKTSFKSISDEVLLPVDGDVDGLIKELSPSESAHLCMCHFLVPPTYYCHFLTLFGKKLHIHGCVVYLSRAPFSGQLRDQKRSTQPLYGLLYKSFFCT